MRQYLQPHARGVLHSRLHQSAVGHGVTVVGNRDYARFFHGQHIGEFFALKPFGYRAHGVNVRESFVFRRARNKLRYHAVVAHRVGIRHTENIGKAAAYRGAHSGNDSFLALVAGLTEVRVKVAKAVEQIFTRTVDDDIGVSVHSADLGYHAVANEHVGFLYVVANEFRVLYQYRCHIILLSPPA